MSGWITIIIIGVGEDGTKTVLYGAQVRRNDKLEKRKWSIARVLKQSGLVMIFLHMEFVPGGLPDTSVSHDGC